METTAHHSDAPAPAVSGIWPVVFALFAAATGLSLFWWREDDGNAFLPVLAPVLAGGVLLAACVWVMSRKSAASSHTAAPPTQAVRLVAQPTPLGADEFLAALRANPQLARATVDLWVERTPEGNNPVVDAKLPGVDATQAVAVMREATTAAGLKVTHSEVRSLNGGAGGPMGFRVTAGLMGFTAIVAVALGIGATVAAFQDNWEDATVEAAVKDPYNVVALDNRFNQAKLVAPPNTAVTFNLKNDGKAKHNLHFLTAKGGETLAPGSEGKLIDGGQSDTIAFTTPGPGTYYFLCDVHPDQMDGPFEVKAGAPATNEEAEARAAAAAASGERAE
ncbi:MAG: cupredoxin domain-containing protein [Dehalococcoidia bacterium]